MRSNPNHQNRAAEGGLAVLFVVLCLGISSWGARLIPVPAHAIGFGTSAGVAYGVGSKGASPHDVITATHRFLLTWSPALDAETGTIIGADGWGAGPR